jgi:tetratricopeptide (TPR) repeat protein
MRAVTVALEIVVAGILAATAHTVAAGNEVSTERAEGLRLYQAGRFQEAIPLFDRVLARRERDLEIYMKRGACYLRTEQPEKALADFDRVNQYSQGFGRFFPPRGFLTPSETWLPTPTGQVTFAESYGNRGIALLMLGRNEEALQSFLAATQLWSLPENRPGVNRANTRAQLRSGRAAAYQGLGQAYYRLGQNEQAYYAYSEAVALNPADANGFAGRGDILRAVRMPDLALADYSQAIQLDPSHSRAICGRGTAFMDLGRDAEAQADFDRAIALDAKFAKAYRYRGALRSRRGENEAALADFDRVVALLPDEADAYKDRGGVLVRMGQFERAITELDHAIRIDSKNAAAFQNRGAAYNGLSQYQRAIEDLTLAIELDPRRAGAYSNRGLAHFAMGEYDQAIADLSQAVQLAPQEATPYFNRAEVFARLGLSGQAIQDYTEAIRLDPRMNVARVALARLHAGLGQRERALHDLDMALQLDPKKAAVYFDRGNLLREQGDWRGALAAYDRAIVLEPKRAELYVARGWSRLCAGVEGADYDARAFLMLKGWRDAMSPYMALLAVTGARSCGRPGDAQPVLDEALANTQGRSWPVPILRYLKGGLSAADLLRGAVTMRQQAEAHTFLGLDRLQAGDAAAALDHLRWARDHSASGSIAGDVARATLARIDTSHPDRPLP